MSMGQVFFWLFIGVPAIVTAIGLVSYAVSAAFRHGGDDR